MDQIVNYPDFSGSGFEWQNQSDSKSDNKFEILLKDDPVHQSVSINFELKSTKLWLQGQNWFDFDLFL